jgi:hypothetical protein
MPTLLVPHDVADFATWGKAYDDFDAERETLGVKFLSPIFALWENCCLGFLCARIKKTSGLHRRRRMTVLRMTFVFSILLLFATATAFAQTLEVTGSASSYRGALSDNDGFMDVQASMTASGSASTLIGPGPLETASFRTQLSASASYGTLRVSAFSEAIGGQELIIDAGLTSGSTGALFEDYITIVPSRPELSNTQGTARVRILLSGLVNVDAGGALDSNANLTHYAKVRFGSRNCDQFDPGCADATSYNARDLGSLGGGFSEDGTPLPPTFVTVPLPFYFDQPFMLGVELGAIAQADADEEAFTASASVDLGNSLHWDGFVEVLDGSGQVVADYTIDSFAGIDWTQQSSLFADGFESSDTTEWSATVP